MLVVIVPHYLLQLVMEKQQKLLQPLRHLRLQLLQLVRRGWMRLSDKPSWISTTESALQLEFRRSRGATV
jgi:hypothetical protein